MTDKTDLDALKKRVDLLTVISGDFQKVADTCGGEYAGPCPLCGGKDRFRIQPFFEGGRWFCRGCGDGRWHSVFDYLMVTEGISFQEAIERVKAMAGVAIRPPDPVRDEIDHEAWQHRAIDFIHSSTERLGNPECLAILDYLHNRGLNNETIDQWRIGANPSTVYEPAKAWGCTGNDICLPAGAVIPCFDNQVHYIKIRRIPHDKGSKYHLVRGSRGWLFGGKTCSDGLTAVLYESEFDVILGWQNLQGVGHCSLPAGQPMKDAYLPILARVEDVVVAYDNDDPGQNAADELCKLKHFHKADKLPFGKDLTEFYQSGGNVFDYLYSQIGKIPGRVE